MGKDIDVIVIGSGNTTTEIVDRMKHSTGQVLLVDGSQHEIVSKETSTKPLGMTTIELEKNELYSVNGWYRTKPNGRLKQGQKKLRSKNNAQRKGKR